MKFFTRIRPILRPPAISREEFQKLHPEEKAAAFRRYLWHSARIQMMVCGGLLAATCQFHYFLTVNFDARVAAYSFMELVVLGFFAVLFPTLWDLEKFERFPWADDYPEDWEESDDEPPKPKFAADKDARKAGRWALKKYGETFRKLGDK